MKIHSLSLIIFSNLARATLAPRQPFDNAFYVYNGAWPCSQEQRSVISSAIDEAKTLAQAAIDILSKPGAESSVAFESWFGASNATPERKKIILNRHFQAVLENLVPATAAAQFRLNRKPFLNPQEGFAVTESSIVYGCPPLDAPVCSDSTIAAVQSRTGSAASAFGATFLVLCPAFFQDKLSLDAQVQLWKTDHTLGSNLSRAATLVHEVQHMLQATESEEERCDDVQDPFENNKDCYSASCCFRLSDAQKIKNAQNYAIYALDVLAFPVTGAAPSSSSCNVARKRDDLPERDLIRRQVQRIPVNGPFILVNTTTSFVSHPESGTGSAFSEPLVSSATNLTSSVVFPTVSETSDTPTLPMTSDVPTTTAPMEPSTTSAAQPTTTVSGGATVIVPVGAVVVGGPGGGFVSVGGALIPVAAGAVVTAKPEPENEQKPSDQDKNESDQPTTTLAPQSSTTESESCSQPTSTASYGSESNAICRDLSGMSEAELLQLIPEFGQVANSADPETTSTPSPASNSTTNVPAPPPPTTLLTATSPSQARPENTSQILPTTISQLESSAVQVSLPTTIPYIGSATNCDLANRPVEACQNLVNGKRACLYTDDDGFLCVGECSEGDLCQQTCQAMQYKAGYCSNGVPSCVCTNDDPTL